MLLSTGPTRPAELSSTAGSDHAAIKMDYRRLGRCGLKVGALSLGAGNFGSGSLDVAAVRELMAVAHDAGINYFDNAESYGNGAAEVAMGNALKQLGWSRLSYVVSTKFYWGISTGPNEKNTLNRKYLLHGIDAALQRMQLEHIDLVYCHRPDPHTPIAETVWALHNMIERGKALYWGTSEWSAPEIEAACAIAERHHLHKPVVEQPEYNLLNRRRVETEYHRVCSDRAIGLAVWSPLAGGVLSGKYLQGVPAESRATDPAMPALQTLLLDRERNRIVGRLAEIAGREGVELAAVAIAWCLRHPQVSTVITGASKPAQLRANLRALELASQLPQAFYDELTAAVGSHSQSWVGSSPWHYQ